MKQHDSRARSVVLCGLMIALMTVTAWITIPIGMVPITLQVFVVIFALFLLTPKQYLVALVVYILIGAVGLPVFSGMRGGLAVIMGPTGGFLWGFILAALVTFLIRQFYKSISKYRFSVSEQDGSAIPLSANKKRSFVLSVLEVGVFLVVMYLCGWVQLMVVAGIGPEAAFLAGVAPFVVIDIIKGVCAVSIAEAVLHVLPHKQLVR